MQYVNLLHDDSLMEICVYAETKGECWFFQCKGSGSTDARMAEKIPTAFLLNARIKTGYGLLDHFIVTRTCHSVLSLSDDNLPRLMFLGQLKSVSEISD